MAAIPVFNGGARFRNGGRRGLPSEAERLAALRALWERRLDRLRRFLEDS